MAKLLTLMINGQQVRFVNNFGKIARRVKMDVLDFNDRFNPNMLVNWLNNIKDYFE